jgi:trehalose 6-phosphate phosphatase
LLNSVLPPFRTDWALFLDVDGTLLEFEDAPDRVVAHAELRNTLAEIHVSLGGALALVSGRSLEDLDAIFSPLRLPAAGLHGHERRDARGDVHRSTVDETVLRWVSEEMQDFAEKHPGALVEDKGLAVALHIRRAPSVSSQAEALVEKIENELPDSFRIQTGKMVFEVKPSGRSKGTAIAAFMSEPPFADRKPVFVGDDVTDEDGFRWVKAHSGKTIKVGPGSSDAQFRLHGVDAVSRWLRDYVDFLARSA